jgi:hypothetical protein
MKNYFDDPSVPLPIAALLNEIQQGYMKQWERREDHMQVPFMRWCLDPKGRTQVSVNPTRVDCVEHFSEAFKAATGEEFPAASKIIMKGKQEYLVQGALDDVIEQLNEPG